MRKLADLPPVMLECIATWNTFRQLEFKTEFLYLLVTPKKLGIRLNNVHGEFIVTCGNRPEGTSNDDMTALWAETCEAWKAAENRDREAVMMAAYITKNRHVFVSKLVMRGFYKAKDKT